MKKDTLKKFQIITAAAVMLVLLFFGCATLITQGRYIAVSVKKNAIDTASPQDSFFDMEKAVFNSVENAFGDSFFMHKGIAPLASRLSTLLMGKRTVESSQVLLGKENWLFYKAPSDGDCLADYKGEDRFASDKLESICQNLSAQKTALEKKGVELVITVIPNKSQIYPQYMPEDIERTSEVSRTDELIDYLQKNSDLKLVYPKEELMSLSEDYPLYYRLDSHWNGLGSYIGYQQIREVLTGERCYLQDASYTFSPDEAHTHSDLLDLTGLYDWFGCDDLYDADISNQPVCDKRVLVVGDSYRESFEAYFEQGFKEARVIHRDDYSPELLEEYAPDTVVLQYVERYSGRMDDFSF